MFIDEVQIHVIGGNGGAGSMSFRREAYVPKGGPDGGDGGNGGSVYLEASSSISSLIQFRFQHHFAAGRAQHGKGAKKHGANGDDLVLLVPVGTQIFSYDEDNKAKGELLGDLTKSGQRLLVGPGGHGGLGNTHFVTPTHRAPAFAELGEPAEGHWIDLEMKLLADVALVGLPSVGKSSLIAQISAAKPKIAAYPFTTLVPNLGMVNSKAGSFVVADIPGLIAGAARGKGLGHAFLRHIERSALLIHMIDLTGDFNQRDPLRDYDTINSELAAYNSSQDKSLATRPQVIVLNKADAVDAELADFIKSELTNKIKSEQKRDSRKVPPIFTISTITKQGISELVDYLATRVKELRQQEAENIKQQDTDSQYGQVWRLDTEQSPKKDFEVRQLSKGIWEINGASVKRAVIQTEMDNDEAVIHLQKRLQNMGVDESLREAGAVPGDEIRILNRTFEFSG